jgi:signal transduction histidine kinase
VAETLDSLALHAAALFGCDACCVFVWDFTHDVLRPGSAVGVPRARVSALRRLTIRRAQTRAWDRVLEAGAPVALSPLPRDLARALGSPWQAAWALPLRHAGRLHGVACLLDRRRPARAALPARDLVAGWCATAALAINLAQLVEYERATSQQASAWVESWRDLAASRELREVLQRLGRRVVAALPARACVVVLRDAERGVVRVVALAGVSSDFAALAQGKEFPDVLSSVFGRRAYRIAPGRRAAQWLPVDPEVDRYGALLLVPLRHGRSLLGMLAVVARPRTRFGARHIEAARTWAHQAAMAVETARLYQREQYAAEQARVLLEIATMPSDHDAGFLRHVAHRARAAVDAAACSIWLLDDRARRLLLTAQAGGALPTASARAPQMPARAFAPWHLGATEPVLAERGLPELARRVRGIGRGATVVAPIRTGTRTFGVMVTSSRVLAAAHARMLAAIARMAAVRLEEVALQRDAAARNREIARHRERERIARDLHDTVLQTLVGIHLQVEALRHRPPAGEAQLAALGEAVRDELRTMREFTERLRAPPADAPPPAVTQRTMRSRRRS